MTEHDRSDGADDGPTPRPGAHEAGADAPGTPGPSGQAPGEPGRSGQHPGYQDPAIERGERPDSQPGDLSREIRDTDPTPREPPRAIAILVSVVAAACLIAACFSHRWLANRHLGDFGYSPLSYQECSVHCETMSNFQVFEIAQNSPFDEQRVSRVFPIAGVATFVALLVAAAGLLVAAAIAAVHRRPDLPVSPTTFALLGLMIGLITGCVFVATKPGEVGAVGVAWSFWAFGVGAVAGIAGAQLLAKQIRPTDPDLLHDAMNPDQF